MFRSPFRSPSPSSHRIEKKLKPLKPKPVSPSPVSSSPHSNPHPPAHHTVHRDRRHDYRRDTSLPRHGHGHGHGHSRSTSHSTPSRLREVTSATGATTTVHRGRSISGKTQMTTSASPVVTITVGPEGRLFAAHEDVLTQSPYFAAVLRSTPGPTIANNKRISLPDEEPAIFSAVLEFLYKKEYYPRLIHDEKTGEYALEGADGALANPYASPVSLPGSPRSLPPDARPSPKASPNLSVKSSSNVEATVDLPSVGSPILRDTAIYCAATTYFLPALCTLALRKQGLQSGIDVGTILRSAQYAYANTPDDDSRLRAHYLALIIRCRRTFKRSGTMQGEMEKGGSKLFFDLFVALCNHLDDVIEASSST